jgi:tryptophan halogenase
MFKDSGNIIRYPWEIFGADSWLAVFNGLNYLPSAYDIRADDMDSTYLDTHLEKMKSMVKTNVGIAPTHTEFLMQHCGYIPK